MKKLLLILITFLTASAYGQTVDRTRDKNYYGQATFGTESNTYIPTDQSAWIEIGADGTNKGIIMPRVDDTSDIPSPAKGLMIFLNSDSTIRYFTGYWTIVGHKDLSAYLTKEDADSIYLKQSDSTVKYVTPTGLRKGQNIDTVQTISQLENYSGKAYIFYVTDSLKGGLFEKIDSTKIPDGIFYYNSLSTAKEYKRIDDIYNIDIKWLGANPDSSAAYNRLILDSIIYEYPKSKIIIPAGINIDYSKNVTGKELPQSVRISDYNRNIDIVNNTAIGGALEGKTITAGNHVFTIRGVAPGNRGALYIMPNITDSTSATVSKIDLFLDDYSNDKGLYRTAGFYSVKDLGTWKQGIYALNSKVAGNYWFANPEWWQTMRDLHSVSMKWINYSTDIPDSIDQILPWQPNYHFDSGQYAGSLTDSGRIYQCIKSGWSGSDPLSGLGEITDSTSKWRYIITLNPSHFYNQTQVSDGPTTLNAVRIPNLGLMINSDAALGWGDKLSFLKAGGENLIDDSVSIYRKNNDLYLSSLHRTGNLRINPSFAQVNNLDMMIQTSANNGSALQVGGDAWIDGNVIAKKFEISDLNVAPSSATAPGKKGELRITADYIYVCIAADTWVRCALNTW